MTESKFGFSARKPGILYKIIDNGFSVQIPWQMKNLSDFITSQSAMLTTCRKNHQPTGSAIPLP